MKLQLPYPPTPEFAPRLAALIVPVAMEVSNVALDYSPQSLEDVDGIVESFRVDGVLVDQVKETLFCFGCYVGEVFVRQARGVWRVASDTPMADVAGWALVIELGPKSHCNPIGKVFKRFENGNVDALPYFYAVFTRHGPGSLPAKEPRAKAAGRRGPRS